MTVTKYLVETDWVEKNLGDPNLFIFDCTTELGTDENNRYIIQPQYVKFEDAHIPGAQFIDVQEDVSDPTHRFKFMQPSSDYFINTMRRFGVNNDSHVILYSTGNVIWATRVWWLFHLFGFDQAAVLNGGWQKWQRENRSIEKGVATRRASGNFTITHSRSLMVSKDEVLQHLNDDRVCLINALTPQQFAGTGGRHYGRPGRIKGSVNLPVAELLDPNTHTFLAEDELRKKFSAIDALNREVIVYCGGGISASADAFILKLLGHQQVKLYDASLSEWAKDPHLPMEQA